MGSFEDLYRLHVRSVFRFAMSVTGNREEAADLTSEAFLALHRNLASIDQSLLPRWVLPAVRNRARDAWRRKVVEERHRAELRHAPAASAPPLEEWILYAADLKPIPRLAVIL